VSDVRQYLRKKNPKYLDRAFSISKVLHHLFQYPFDDVIEALKLLIKHIENRRAILNQDVIVKLLYINSDDLNGVVVSNADCQSKGPGFESRVSHGPFQKV
jgi:hypothetical protein